MFCLLSVSFSVLAQQIPYSNTIKLMESDSKELIIEKAAHIIPTKNQFSALQNEFIAFIHFGPNTFTRMEWGNGKENPEIFDLKELDTDQWCKAMKAAGMKMVIITVKHHDGFVLWQSRYTKHGIMSTGFQDGHGDILKDLSVSCKKYGLKLGVYLSPADLYQIENPEGLYGNLSKYSERTIPRAVPGRPFKNKTSFRFVVDDYNEYFLNQLFEILTEYGPISEVWFDGAHPKTKGGQKYNYPAWKKLIHTLAPKAVIFGREDIRWCGNESGATRKTEWNVIPYSDNPDTTSHFPDMTNKDLGSNEKLYNAKYLHYQQAETNTSIREGWFYRDDEYQKVRSADDVFDIYERAVGGNSTFLLNIPPNRNGKFSSADVLVLEEVGKRIKETYNVDLLKNAAGPKQVLDNNGNTFLVLNKNKPEIIITAPSPITINRLVIQEAVATQGERIVKHAVDAWTGNQWKEIAAATNAGYKRILRFPEVTTNKIRIRILESRLSPAISKVSAHYYKTHPPLLSFSRDKNGMVAIIPQIHEFNWKPHGENSFQNLNAGYEIYYTTDGSQPGVHSLKYTQPVQLENVELKAVAFSKGEAGAVHTERIGISKKNWRLLSASSETKNHDALKSFDANRQSYWQSEEGSANAFLAIDLGAVHTITAMVYTPQTANAAGMIAKGIIQVSDDGLNWRTVENFSFGNLVNDPGARTHYFKQQIQTRYLRVEAKEIEGNSKCASIAELDFL